MLKIINLDTEFNDSDELLDHYINLIEWLREHKEKFSEIADGHLIVKNSKIFHANIDNEEIQKSLNNLFNTTTNFVENMFNFPEKDENKEENDDDEIDLSDFEDEEDYLEKLM